MDHNRKKGIKHRRKERIKAQEERKEQLHTTKERKDFGTYTQSALFKLVHKQGILLAVDSEKMETWAGISMV